MSMGSLGAPRIYIHLIRKVDAQIEAICAKIGVPYHSDAGEILPWPADLKENLLDGVEFIQTHVTVTGNQDGLLSQNIQMQIANYRMFFDAGAILKKVEKWGPEKDKHGYLVQDTNFSYEV